MSKNKNRLRFAFTLQEGPRKYRTAGSWRVWVNKEDTYIAPAGLGSIWKASLHGDVAWRIAITSEHAGSPEPVIDPAIGRKMWEFDPVPFKDGKRLAFAIAPLRASYYKFQEPNQKEVHIGVNDSWDEITVAYIWMTEPGIELEADRIIGGPLPLTSGRQVWLTAGVEQCRQTEELDIVGSMIEPQIPGQHEVHSPGFFVRGLRFDE